MINQIYLGNMLESDEILKLQQELNGTKVFLNMVIHDLRNPASQVSFACEEILKRYSTEKINTLEFIQALI
jgi:hypothetical protein